MRILRQEPQPSPRAATGDADECPEEKGCWWKDEQPAREVHGPFLSEGLGVVVGGTERGHSIWRGEVDSVLNGHDNQLLAVTSMD